jgi:gliding motility-associated-like protein
MKKSLASFTAYLLVLFLVLPFTYCTAQNGVWTWMKGAPTISPSGIYGTQGVSSPLNVPPGSYEAADWTDLSGNFWIFGGLEIFTNVMHTGIWKYNVSTNEWTWMQGPQTTNNAGVYGTQGVPSPANYPGSRSFGARTWTDMNGNFWLFGGLGFDVNGFLGPMNDLWKYNTVTNEWTWMHGPQVAYSAGNYGTQGVPAPSNLPQYSWESTATWIDNNGDLWTFGGIGASVGDDVMWRYSIATNEWTWMSGQTSSFLISPSHGTMLVPSASNTPGSRFVYSHFQDNQGNFWLFGDSFNGFADMWMYNPSTLLWTWMGGSNIPYDTATFTTQCVPGGYPRFAPEDRACWTDLCGRFWGMGSDYSLLWMFDPATNQFTWITGSLSANPAPVIGMQNVPSPANYPMGVFGANGFVDNTGNLWLFGGGEGFFTGGTTTNMLYRYQIDPFCPGTNASAAFLASPATQGCAPFNVQFNSSGQNTTAWHWDFGDSSTTTDTSSLSSPQWTFTQPGSYTVTLIVTSQNSCSNLSDTQSVVINVLPQPAVNLGNDTTLCNAPVNLLLNAGNSGSIYTWNNAATTQTIIATSPGWYSVWVQSDTAGLCTDQDSILLTLSPQPDLGGDTTLCANQSLLLDPGITGTQYNWSTGATSPTITVSTPGLYSVQIINPPCALSSSMNLNITPLPIVNLGADTTLCPGDSILLNAQNPGATFLWSNAANTQTITASATGNYAVTVTAQNCSNSDTIFITTTQNLAFNEIVSLCGSFGPLVLDAGNPGAAYLWSTGASTQTISIEQPGTYWVTVNAPPCVLTDTVLVTGNIGEATVYIPNSFTPNGDGLNDRFSGYGESFSSFRLLIFNRWGELIFETTDPAGWDGNFNGTKVTDDVYVYKLTYTSACTGGKFVDRLGHVLLIR